MAPVGQQLPVRFPCWCKAVYSWGGETKRDLGFIEGDLIECLNAGDGSWWMGRLWRDKRMIGLFPSNFVEILGEDFRPTSRSASPMPMNGASNGSTPSPAPNKSSPAKSKSVFRKPFGAYAAAQVPNPAAAARRLAERMDSTDSSPRGSFSRQHSPFASMKRPSPMPSRATSPAVLQHRQSHYRGVSPAPSIRRDNSNRGDAHAMGSHHHPAHAHALSRAASPAPRFDHSRGPSPVPQHMEEQSPPPPAPPPHRVAYQPSRAPSAMSYNDYDQAGSPPPLTPQHAPSRGEGFSPSPLTSAMNDVMSSLQTMSVSRKGSDADEPPTPPNFWSPEAFDDALHKANHRTRAQTSMGIANHEHDQQGVYKEYGQGPDPLQSRPEGNNHVSDYVEKMERRLRQMHEEDQSASGSELTDRSGRPNNERTDSYRRPILSSVAGSISLGRSASRKSLRNRKSAYELGRDVLGRTFTTKSSGTVKSSSTNATQSTNHSLMSGASAGGFSATSAGSLARRKFGLGSQRGRPMSVIDTRTDFNQAFGSNQSGAGSNFTGPSYHSSHASRPGSSQSQWAGNSTNGGRGYGGLMQPKQKRSGFFKKIIDSAKTGAATARSTISAGGTSRPGSRSSRPASRAKSNSNGITGISGGGMSMPPSVSSAARDMGLGGGGGGNVDWVQVRRDINRSNSLSKNEMTERMERCELMDVPVLNPLDILYDTAEGDEGLDGLPIGEPTDFSAVNLSLVDKSARFVQSIPPMTTPANLAQGYVCRPYRSDVQRLRAIFTWVSERIGWEDDFEGEIDSRRVIQSKRGCSEEIAVLVAEMCAAVGLHAEVVRGYLKSPGEAIDFAAAARPNHWWNAVIVDGEWRAMDCALASPTNPKRCLYSSAGSAVAESWWFLARPMEICFTHVPLLPEQQHICPPVQHEVLMALPCACPPYFRNRLQLANFCTSVLTLEGLELAHVLVNVPGDTECIAEVEAKSFAQDADGDYFENGDIVRKPALSQPEWVDGQKRYTVKALLPGDEGHGVLRVYAGKRGLMHSIKSNPHALAFALPITHTGINPPYSFLTIHPTPHAQRHDLYVAQPQCHRLAINNTFVFTIRQHPSSLLMSNSPPTNSSAANLLSGAASIRSSSPHPHTLTRPASAMSLASISASGSQFSSHPSSNASSAPSNSSSATTTHSTSSLSSGPQKPAKLAIQSPAGKIIRLVRRADYGSGHGPGASEQEGGEMGSVWETIIKVGERGTWRGLVLADRSARWCVFAEWDCVA